MEKADDFVFVHRKRKGKGRKSTTNETPHPGRNVDRQPHTHPSRTGGLEVNCVDKETVKKKICMAKDELRLSDFYTTFVDLLLHFQHNNDVLSSSSSTPLGDRVNNSCRKKGDTGIFKPILDLLQESESCTDGVRGHICKDDVVQYSVQTVVGYGLGNFSDCLIARYQLALLLLMCDFLKIEDGNCQVYDPKFTAVEKQILCGLEMNVISQNEEGKRVVSDRTLFYMPHCGKALYNNLLWANWDPENLSAMVIIGNSFAETRERVPNRVLETDYYYLSKITPYTEELTIPNTFRFADIFNDTSVHSFPLERLRTMPPADWEHHTVPQYDEDVEIIRKEPR